MDKGITYSIEEANYITSNQEILPGEPTLSDWILMLFYANKDNSIDGITRLTNEIFLMYNEIIAKDNKTDLFILFVKDESGIYSEDIENTVDDLLFTNYLNNEDESHIDIEGSILLSSKGSEYIRKEFDRLAPTIRDMLQSKRREWDKLTMANLIKLVDIQYPYYSLSKSTKADIWYNKGNDILYDYASEQINAAIMYYNKALAINPDYDLAWNHKGEALQKLAKHKEAIDCFDKAIEINPKLATAWEDRAESLRSLERYDEASKSLDKVKEIDRKNETVQNNNSSVESK